MANLVGFKFQGPLGEIGEAGTPGRQGDTVCFLYEIVFLANSAPEIGSALTKSKEETNSTLTELLLYFRAQLVDQVKQERQDPKDSP